MTDLVRQRSGIGGVFFLVLGVMDMGDALCWHGACGPNLTLKHNASPMVSRKEQRAYRVMSFHLVFISRSWV